jgi:predicted CXXCH cytochrome family protein
MADEDRRTPPDKMFDRADVTKFCTVCHDSHTKGEVAELIARGDNVCTDCHGKHRIEGRGTDPLWQ